MRTNEDEDQTEEQYEDLIQISEHNAKAKQLAQFKEMLSNSSRRCPRYIRTLQSNSIQSELNQFRLKFKSTTKLTLDLYKDSLEKKISQLKEKIATSYRSTISTIQPLPHSLFNQLLNQSGCISLRLIEFLTPSELHQLLKVKDLHRMLVSAFKEGVNKRFRQQYEKKYARLLDSHRFILCIKHYERNKGMNSRVYITISSMISVYSKESERMNDYLNKTICVKYIIDYHKPGKISNCFVFDVFPRGSINNYWVFKEYTSFHYDDLEKAYYSNLISFNQGDRLKVSIDLFTENGFVNLNTFHWCKLIVRPTIRANWLMSSISSTAEENLFPLRYCEVETLRNEWKDISQMNGAQAFTASTEAKFGNSFTVKQIFFDDVGYYLFKILLTAKRKGPVEDCKDIGIAIDIKEHHSSIENFVKKNDLILEETNELNIRVGDLLVFYLSHRK